MCGEGAREFGSKSPMTQSFGPLLYFHCYFGMLEFESQKGTVNFEMNWLCT